MKPKTFRVAVILFLTSIIVFVPYWIGTLLLKDKALMIIWLAGASAAFIVTLMAIFLSALIALAITYFNDGRI